MALREILCYPDKRLAQLCQPVEEINDEIRQLVEDMNETCAAMNGLGLAAPQVAVPMRICIVDIAYTGQRRWIPERIPLLNPVLTELTAEETHETGTQRNREGCLSLPGIFDFVHRPKTARITAFNLEGSVVRYEPVGFQTHIFCHELDHLDGKLFLDRLGPLQRKLIVDKIRKLQKKGVRQMRRKKRGKR